MPEDRRLAAIMFSDIVGYTALMGSDEDRAFNVLAKNREIHTKLIIQFNGTLIKEMGDGMLISFHLSSEAVRCAMAIQAESKKQEIPLKIGIHEGEMVFTTTDVLGDGVNIASRLQEDAPVGCIIISGSVYKDIKNKSGIHTKFLEEKSFKNVDDPVKIYKVYSEDEKEDKPVNTPLENTLSSIAILPFTNMSNDPDQEYFCDGMSEEIINALAHIRSLKVIARTSSFAYKGKHKDMREIGKKLGVETLLEGSVRKSGNRLRITTQLIKVSDGSHLWSERYDRELEDVFAIQDEISIAIVEKLKIKLLGKEKEAIAKRSTEDLEAYNLYLMGNHYLGLLSEAGYKKASDYYEQALKIDPNYSLAYIGLAAIPYFSSFWGNNPPITAMEKAKDYTNKALDIDNTLGEAYGLLGNISLYYEWNYESGEKELKKAIDFNPNSSLALSSYAFLLSLLNMHKEAEITMLDALKIDPLSLFNNTMLGQIYLKSGQVDKQIEIQKQTITLNPNYFMSHFHLGIGYHTKFLMNEAIEEYNNAIELSGGYPLIMAWLACAYHEAGNHDQSNKIIKELEEKVKTEYIPATCFIQYFLIIGNKDKAYRWLKKGISERDGYIPWWVSLVMKGYGVPEDPKFHELLNKVGFKKIIQNN